MLYRVVFVFCLLLLPGLASAGCRIQASGSRCVLVPQTEEALPAVQIGEVLERGRYSTLMNTDYYGLPPARDGWVYMRVERGLYRVDWRSREVLEEVSDQANSRF